MGEDDVTGLLFILQHSLEAVPAVLFVVNMHQGKAERGIVCVFLLQCLHCLSVADLNIEHPVGISSDRGGNESGIILCNKQGAVVDAVPKARII